MTRSQEPTRRNLPVVTLALVSIAVLFALFPGAMPALEYDRARVVSAGEWWRILSGQLVHWNMRMALLDLGMLLLLGLWAESTAPRVTRVLLLVAWPLIGAGIHFWPAGLSTYRGASGLASALFVWVALLIATKSGSPWVRLAAISAPFFLALKLLLESSTGVAVFAGPLPAGVRVTPSAHLLGCGVALGVFLAGRGKTE